MYYFASDIHLGAGSRQEGGKVERRFAAWLDAVSKDAEAIFLVGDVFDFWFEYNKVVPKGFARVLGKLAELTDRGVRVVFFTGNHDMWVRGYLADECGLEICKKPQVMELAGRRVFIAHGDNMKIDGKPMLKLMNAVFRSRLLYRMCRWFVPVGWMMRFGLRWSAHSRKSHGASDDFTEKVTEPLIEYAREYAAGHEVDDFVFGHMHFARDYREGALHVVNLGCWSADKGSYAVMDASGEITLKSFGE